MKQLPEIFAYPTESFFAFGAKANDALAIQRVRRLKSRSAAKPIAVIAADLRQVRRFFYLNAGEARLARRFWPGALTLVLRPKRRLAARALGVRRIGVRVPLHVGARRLARRLGVPITATSANRTGQRPTKSAAAVRRQFPGILVIPGRCGRARLPSTVVNFQHGKLIVIRPGSVSPNAG